MHRLDSRLAMVAALAAVALIPAGVSGAPPAPRRGEAVLTGQVVDGQGGALPGATVELVALDSRGR